MKCDTDQKSDALMNEEQAARLLLEAYDQAAATREQATAVHLFGIRYAEELVELSLPAILKRAGLPASYSRELRKGIKLAAYVTLRD